MIKKNIPNLMTLTHLSLGMMAIISAFEGKYSHATFLVILGMLLDGLDGRVARALGVSGDFGKELDSLADVVTFGVAPAMILYNASFHQFDAIGLLLTVLFPICGVLRLARFNINGYKISKYFIGLPITAAGGILAIISVYHFVFHPAILIVLSLSLSFLMVSNIKYPNFKKIAIPTHAYIVTPIMIIFIFMVSKWFPQQFPMIIFIPIVFFVFFLFYRIKRSVERKKDPVVEELDEEDILE